MKRYRAAALAAAVILGTMTGMAVPGCGSDPDLYDRDPATSEPPQCGELTGTTTHCDGQ